MSSHETPETDFAGWKGHTPAFAIVNMLRFHEGKNAGKFAAERMVEMDEIINAAIERRLRAATPADAGAEVAKGVEYAIKLRQVRADMLGTDDEVLFWICHEAAALLESLSAQVEALKRENEAIRTLMNVYNLGGWTDAIAPMERALAAEQRADSLHLQLSDRIAAVEVQKIQIDMLEQDKAALVEQNTALRAEREEMVPPVKEWQQVSGREGLLFTHGWNACREAMLAAGRKP